MYIFAPKCKNRDLNVIGAISFTKHAHYMVEGMAVKSSSNIVNAI